MINKLQTGSELRIIAPSRSYEKIRTADYQRALVRVEALGYKVTFGKNIKNVHRFNTASVADRLADLHDAYQDPNVKLIWCLHGGWSANELLTGIDWDIVVANPKPLLGFSDITVLLNAIYAKTGQIGLLGPNFSSIGARTLYQYSIDNLNNVLQNQAKVLMRSKQWGDGKSFVSNTQPWKVINDGQALGTAVGGNVGTFYLLQGTDYAPKFTQDTILLAEDDSEAGKMTAREFDRRLESILQQNGARQYIKGIIIGRFQPDSKVMMPDIADIVSRKISKYIPVFAGVDFGHTRPFLTLPIGGKLSMYIKNNQAVIELLEY